MNLKRRGDALIRKCLAVNYLLVQAGIGLVAQGTFHAAVRAAGGLQGTAS
jgi:hypothetical protein